MDDTNSQKSIKAGVFVLVVLVSLYIMMFYFNFFEKKPEPEGIIVHLLLFFKLTFSNISPIL